MSEEKFLYELMSSNHYMNICNEVLATRKEDDEGAVTYDAIEYTVDNIKYTVQGHHYPVQSVFERANNKCSKCSSKGYITINVPKNKLPDPSGYFVEEVDEKLDEKGNPIESKFWRITTPCECAVKNVIRDNGSVFTIDTRCVFVSISYTAELTDEDDTSIVPKIEIY